MAGFSSEEQSQIAALLANQRRKPKREWFERVDPAGLDDIIRLAILLRLAVRLNRGRDPDRPPCVLKVKKDRLRLVFPEGWLDEHPLTQFALEDEARYLSSLGYNLSLKEGTTVE